MQGNTRASQLLVGLQNPDPVLRWHALRQFGEHLNDPAMVEAAGSVLLSDPAESVREMAARIVTLRSTKEALRAARECLEREQSPFVLHSLTQRLAASRRGAEVLLSVLLPMQVSEVVRRCIIHAAGGAMLVEYQREENDFVRERHEDALVVLLENALKRDPSTENAIAACRELLRIPMNETLLALLPAVQGARQESVQLTIAQGVFEIVTGQHPLLLGDAEYTASLAQEGLIVLGEILHHSDFATVRGYVVNSLLYLESHKFDLTMIHHLIRKAREREGHEKLKAWLSTLARHSM